MASIAKVVVEISLDREFDYRIPVHLQASIRVGSQVTVPFQSRELRGFVVGLADRSAFGDRLKEIAGIVGDKPLIPDSVMKLAYWIADYYCAPIEHAVRTVLPSAVRKRGAKHKKQLVVSLNADAASNRAVQESETRLEASSTSESGGRNVDAASSRITLEQVAPMNCFDPGEPVAHLNGNLPHWRQDGATYFVTFRLADSLPQEKLKQWCEERDEWLKQHPRPDAGSVDATPSSRFMEWQRQYRSQFTERIEEWLDAGSGSCLLSDEASRGLLSETLDELDGVQYRLLSYVIMPNHVHVVIAPLKDHTLSAIIQSWKSVSSRKIMKRMGLHRGIWQKESFDHIVRNAESLEKFKRYIEANPVGLSADQYTLYKGKRDGGVASTLPPKQQVVVDALRQHGQMTLSELKEHCGCSESPVRTLEKKGIVSIEETTILRDPHAGFELLRTEPFTLMAEQQTALETICSAMDREPPGTVLLHGVTGSGKTEVYLQAIRHALDQGRGAIVLVPEISLTPQTVDRFRARFGDCVAVLHSSLSEGERHDEWHRIRNGEAQIAIGARSALFAPVERLGLIVVDEEHEPTYKQDESPRYHARDVAVMRGRMEGCCVVLGSATPALESFHNVKAGRYDLAEMKLRVDDRSMPLMRIIDMRIEAEKEGRPHIFSTELVQGIYDRLDRREQVILFLNRRGFSSSLQCEKCGYVSECSACSVSMNYHKGAHRLLCHICGAEESVPERCPECGDPGFRYPGMGTERIEEVLQKLCPSARVVRMDSDTMRRKDAYRTVLDQFKTGKIDILLGTQMIAKGLDFPNVTLVGVLHADLSLNMPDFRAGERTFQLLTQVAGRAGRGEKAGEVIVQAYTPHHPAIQAARSLDYDGFGAQDLEFRRELGYPPYTHLVLLTFRGENEAAVMQTADAFFARLEKILPKTVLHGPPMPAPLARAKGLFRYQIMLRCEHTVRITKPVRHVLATFQMPKTVQCTVDVDALSLL